MCRWTPHVCSDFTSHWNNHQKSREKNVIIKITLSVHWYHECTFALHLWNHETMLKFNHLSGDKCVTWKLISMSIYINNCEVPSVPFRSVPPLLARYPLTFLFQIKPILKNKGWQKNFICMKLNKSVDYVFIIKRKLCPPKGKATVRLLWVSYFI